MYLYRVIAVISGLLEEVTKTYTQQLYLKFWFCAVHKSICDILDWILYMYISNV